MRKKIIFILAMFVMLIMGMQFSTKSVKAMTITESGKYSLVLYTRASDDDAEIDGKFSKLIRFNFDEGEETIKVSEITKGITSFNGKTEFEGDCTNVKITENDDGTGSVTLILEASTEKVPDVKPEGGAGSGFDVDVDGWGNEINTDIPIN